MNFTICTTYYDQPKMLQAHLNNWNALALHGVSIILVDDASPRYPAKDVLGDEVRQYLSLFRLSDNIPWNINGARNVAMSHATGWSLLLDLDHQLPVEAHKQLVQEKLSVSTAYRFPRISSGTGELRPPGANIFLMHQSHFWRCGGYDERLSGFYGHDKNFRRRVALTGNVVDLDIKLLNFSDEDIPDASTLHLDRRPFRRTTRLSPRMALIKHASRRAKRVLSFPYEQIF